MHKFGYVAIIGRPNVGKSTILNSILGEKVSIVTAKPQTTRKMTSGVYSDDDSQIVFLDSPGFHDSKKPLNKVMMEEVSSVISRADCAALVLEAGIFPTELESKLWTMISKKNPLCVINKADLMSRENGVAFVKRVKELLPISEAILISALNNDGVTELLSELKDRVPKGEAEFPKDEYTRHSTRFLVSELIREQVFLQLHEELPYSIAVDIEEFREPVDEKGMTSIKAVIVVERVSQKSMVIGKDGKKIKKIGIASREEIERLVGGKVFLDLFVKVAKDWTKDPRSIKELY